MTGSIATQVTFNRTGLLMAYICLVSIFRQETACCWNLFRTH